MNRKFWKNKKILITGYEGFLGSNLTKRMISYGANIVGLDINVRRKTTILSENEYDKMVIIKGNVRNFKLLKDVMSNYKIEVIFHLAAEATVGMCLKYPLRTFFVNISGTWNLLEACRVLKIPKIIIIASSDKAYGTHKKLPYKEGASLSGRHPYDVSKSCADLIAYTYFYTYGLPVAITRCGNIYGPGDFNFSRVIPDVMRCVLSNRPFLIRSDGGFTRDYIFVDDVIDGYIKLAENLERLNLAGEAFNFSNETPITVMKLLKKIYQLAGQKPKYKILNVAKYEIEHQYLSSLKARKILSWKPKHTLGEGLKKSIEWYKNINKENR